jgi:hypothetical protein
MNQSRLNRSLSMTSQSYQPGGGLISGDIVSIADLEQMSPEAGRSIVLPVFDTSELGLPDLEELVAIMCKAQVAGVVLSYSDARLLRLLPRMNHLSYLALRSINLDDVSLDFLAALSNLEELTLIGQHTISPDAFAYLAKMPKLRALTVHDARLNDEVIAPVFTNTSLEEFRSSKIRLRGQPTLHGRTLRCWANAARVRSLNLEDWNVSSDDFAYLADHFDVLQNLAIGPDCDLTGLKYLLQLRQLRSLTVSGDALSSEVLAAIGQLTDLEGLTIRVSSLTNDDLGAFSNLHNLKLLSFSSTRVTPAGVFKNLHRLRGFLDLRIAFLVGVSPRRTFRLPKALQKSYQASPVTGAFLAEDLQTHKIFFPELRPDSDFDKP